MNKYISFVVILLSLYSVAIYASAAEETVDIPAGWSNELKAATRNAIQAGLEKDDGLLMARTMIKSRFEESHVVQAQYIVVRALEKNLPVEAIINKAYEGMAKRVPAELVLKAMEKVSSRYEYAYNLAGQLSQEEKIKYRFGSDLVGGLTAGLTRKDVEQIVSQLKEKARDISKVELLGLVSECLLLSRDMARRGVSSFTATRVVSQAVKKGFSAQEVRSMRNSLMSMSAQGSMELAAKGYLNTIRDGNYPQGSSERSGGVSNRGSGGSGENNNSSGGESAGSSSGSGGNSGNQGGGSGGSSGGGSSGGGAGGSSGNGPGH